MLKAGFVSVTDIPRTADRAASRTFYTWRVHQDSVAEKIGIDSIHSMFNLARRLSVESQHNTEVCLLLLLLEDCECCIGYVIC